MGAALGNLNGITNGTQVGRHCRLTVGNLPIELVGVRREGVKYRRNVEAAVIAALGKIDIVAAHAIDTASAAVIHSGICRWLLRERIKDMKPEQILACADALLRGKQVRDKAIRSLNLDRDREADLIQALYSPHYEPPVTAGEPEAGGSTPERAEGG